MNPARLASTFLLLVLSSLAATAATITWKNPAGGLWNQSTNWQPAQVPGPLDTAVIQLAGAFTVQVNSAATVSNLSLGGPGSNPTLSLTAGILTVSQAGNIRDGAVLELIGNGLAGTWTIEPGGRLDISGPAQKNLFNSRILNQGTVRWLTGVVAYDFSPKGFFIPKYYFDFFCIFNNMIIRADVSVCGNDHTRAILMDLIGIKIPKPLFFAGFDLDQRFKTGVKNVHFGRRCRRYSALNEDRLWSRRVNWKQCGRYPFPDNDGFFFIQ